VSMKTETHRWRVVEQYIVLFDTMCDSNLGVAYFPRTYNIYSFIECMICLKDLHNLFYKLYNRFCNVC
jgi:hypothetical protein